MTAHPMASKCRSDPADRAGRHATSTTRPIALTWRKLRLRNRPHINFGKSGSVICGRNQLDAVDDEWLTLTFRSARRSLPD